MLSKAFVFAILVVGIHSQLLSDFQLGEPWNIDQFPRNLEGDIEEITIRDREPLDPNYRDPLTQPTDEKPLVKAKPDQASFNPAVLPNGVVDVPAIGNIPTIDGGILSGFPSIDDFGLSSFDTSGKKPGSLFGGFFSSFGDLQPWWKGPNVCIEREESTDDDDDDVEAKKNDTESSQTERVPNFFSTSISLSNCHQTFNKYECVTKINNHGVVKTFTVRYKCCYGYERTQGSSGCDKKIELKPLMETVTDLGANEFKKLIASSGLDGVFTDENYTLFIPTDQALIDFTDKMLDLNKVDLRVESVRRKRDVSNALSSKDLVLSHASKGFVDLTDIVNEELIYSDYKNSSIRINVYRTPNYQKLLTANCAHITKANNLAKNGIVHLIDGVVAPATQSIPDIIREHRKLTNLRQVFESTDLFKKFKEDGHYTVFAPTDDAFNKIDPSIKEKLLRGEACVKSIIKFHVTPHTVCSSAIQGNATTHNVDGEILHMERTSEDQLILEEKAIIVKSDIMATNGVIHLIDTIIVPESAQHINDALKSQNLSKFYDLIKRAEMTDEIDNLNNATVFAPSDKAFEDEETKKLLEEIGDDKEKLKEIVRYHTIQGQMQSYDMNNNVLLPTRDEGKSLRLNLYSTLPLFTNVVNRATVNCARLVGFDEKSCGSVIHELNKVLVPPKSTILEIINSDEKYANLSNLIKGTDVEKILQEGNQSITFLAPTDEVFASLSQADLKILQDDKKKANEVLKNHVLTEVLCCSGVGPQSWGFSSMVPTLAHQSVQVGRTGDHHIRIGRGVVTNCDRVATNGVIHDINKVMFPHSRPATNFGGFFLFDF